MTLKSAWAIPLFAACGPGSIGVGPETEISVDATEWIDGVDTTDTETEPDPDGCSVVYRADLVPEFDLRISDADLTALQADYSSGVKAWHPAVLAWMRDDGEETIEAQVRLRGNPGFSWIGEKMQFAVSFNEDDPDARFHGLRKLALDASWYNPSGMRNAISYAYLRRAGVPAPCANHAFLSINGAPYGLYENIEFLDQEFLERVFGPENAQDALWKYGSVVTANEEAADNAAVSAYWADPSVSNQLALSNLDANVYEWAAEAVLPQNDGYWCCAHNFYVYEHPEEGLRFIPWDMDYALDATPYWADPYTWYRDSNWQPHFDAVVADPDWGPRLVDAVRLATEAYDAEVLTEQLDAWEALTEEAHTRDPSTPHSVGARRDAIEALRAYLPEREAWLKSWVDCQSGESGDTDGDGYPACSDCDLSDPDIHPGAAEQCNGRDDDCDGITDNSSACTDCQEISWEGTRLLMCPSPRTWEDARAVCQAHGGDLGFPESSGEWYVFWLAQYWDELAWAGVNWWWAGATDAAAEGTWVGVDGAAVAPSWAAGEPGGGRGENCAAVAPGSWQWADGACTNELPSVCRL